MSVKWYLNVQEKRPTYLCKRDQQIYAKRPTNQWKEVNTDLNVCEMIPQCLWKETYVSMKRDPQINEKRPTNQSKGVNKSMSRAIQRDLHLCEKRSKCLWKEKWKETHKSIKQKKYLFIMKDSHIYEKRSVCVSMKRDLNFHEKKCTYPWKQLVCPWPTTHI